MMFIRGKVEQDVELEDDAIVEAAFSLWKSKIGRIGWASVEGGWATFEESSGLKQEPYSEEEHTILKMFYSLLKENTK